MPLEFAGVWEEWIWGALEMGGWMPMHGPGEEKKGA